MSSIALVLGNGESRSKINLSNFLKDYTVIGCNALHRDFIVDHLVCCDRRMGEEAIISENTKTTQIYVREDWFKYFRKIKKDKRIFEVPKLPYEGNLKQDQPFHWGSGPYAVLLAAQLEYTTVILAGFDLYGINERVNNIYKDTKNYSKHDSNPVDPSYWIYQIGKVFQNYPNTDFIIWNNVDWKMPKEWQYPNVKFEHLN